MNKKNMFTASSELIIEDFSGDSSKADPAFVQGEYS